MQGTYEDWAFDAIWSIDEGENYPILLWQIGD